MGTTIYDSDIATVAEKQDLSDTVLDAFMAMMKCKSLENNMQVFSLPSSFLANASLVGLSGVNEAVPSYFYDLWLIPCHINRNHWILFVVFVGKRKILILDSLDRSGVVEGQKKEYLKVSVCFLQFFFAFLYLK